MEFRSSRPRASTPETRVSFVLQPTATARPVPVACAIRRANRSSSRTEDAFQPSPGAPLAGQHRAFRFSGSRGSRAAGGQSDVGTMRGREMMTRVPPSSRRRMAMAPPCAWQIFHATGIPSPNPPFLVVGPGASSCGAGSKEMPGPSSSMRRLSASTVPERPRRMLPRAGDASTALPSRAWTACSRRSGSA